MSDFRKVAMKKVSDAAETAGDFKKVAKAKAGDFRKVAKTKAEDVFENAGETMADVTKVAKEKAGDAFETAGEKMTDFTKVAREKAGDAFKTAKVRGADAKEIVEKFADRVTGRDVEKRKKTIAMATGAAAIAATGAVVGIAAVRARKGGRKH